MGGKQQSEKQEEEPAPARRGKIGNMYIKAAGRVGLVEHTELEPAFVDSLNTLEKYRLTVDSLLSSYEILLQPNPILVNEGRVQDAPGESSYERMAKGLESITKLHPGKEQAKLQSLIQCTQKLAVAERDMQTKGRHSILRTRQFVTIDYETMKQWREELQSSLLAIDDTRHEVKNSKTKELLEEKGKEYKKSIKSFNNVAEKMDAAAESIPETIYYHQREMVKFHVERFAYHAASADILRTVKPPAKAKK